MTDWQRYDPEDKKNTAPSPEALVWVWENGHQGAPSPQVGFFDGYTWRMWWGTDDCWVTHWADISYPGDEPLDAVSEDDDEDDADG